MVIPFLFLINLKQKIYLFIYLLNKIVGFQQTIFILYKQGRTVSLYIYSIT